MSAAADQRLVPLYLAASRLGLVDTHLVLVIIYPDLAHDLGVTAVAGR